MLEFDGNKYCILISVGGRCPKCLKCGKLCHIYHECKACHCVSINATTDDDIKTNCPYKDISAARAKTGREQSAQNPLIQEGKNHCNSLQCQQKAVPALQVPGYSNWGHQALAGLTKRQLAEALEDDGFQLVMNKHRHDHGNTLLASL